MTKHLHSGLFPGHVTHVRHRPKHHRLAYRIFSLLLDLDELGELDRRLRLFSVDRFNLFSFHRRDRGDRSGPDLRSQVERSMLECGLEPDGGPIRLVTMPRVLGFAFNPLSIFFCYGQNAGVRAILWEVDNTFGERHAYMIPVEHMDGAEIVQCCDKAFFVSPFMDMDLHYKFRVLAPADTLSVHIDTFDRDGLVLTARHLARRIALTDQALLHAFLSIPLLALKVVAGIYWEALKIRMKGIRLRTRPRPPEAPVSVVPSSATPRTSLERNG